MKFFRYFVQFIAIGFLLTNCKKEPENRWKVEIKNSTEKVAVQDISKELYDAALPLEKFKEKYPWFQGSVPDEDFEIRRKDPEEIAIYKDAISKIDLQKLNTELTSLFAHVRYYFPEFRTPKVFIYSSALQGIMEPIFYQPEDALLFIDISAFLGDNHPDYKGLETYYQVSMNPQNMVPKVSEIIAENFVQPNTNHQKFIDQLIYNGKIQILQDAFLPDFPDYLKMNYSPKQYEWAAANEANIWNYFVENDLVFSDDIRLRERFITPGPFSKFYTEIDNKSSPQIGIFTGWQICKAFFSQNPKVKLQDFLKMDAQEIFNKSQYKPKN